MNSYFQGITFVTAGEVEDCTGTTSKFFDGYYGIQYNHAGPFFLQIDHDTRWEPEGAHVFLTGPGHHFSYGSPAGTSRHHVFCCFRGPRVEEFQKKGLLVPPPDFSPLRITRPDLFLATMRNLLSILHRPSITDDTDPRAVLLLEDLLLQLQEQPLLPDKDPYFLHALEKLAEDIRNAPNLDWDMEKEAEAIGISATYLRKLFTGFFNCPPHKFVLDCRLQMASDLLLHKQIPISEVAERSGFDDPYYFSRIFKKRKGYSPLRYRAAFAL